MCIYDIASIFIVFIDVGEDRCLKRFLKEANVLESPILAEKTFHKILCCLCMYEVH